MKAETSSNSDHPGTAKDAQEWIKTDTSEVPSQVRQDDNTIEQVTESSASRTPHHFIPGDTAQTKISKKALDQPKPVPIKHYYRSPGPGLGLVTVLLIAALVYLMYTIFHILFITAEHAFLAAFPYMLLALLIVAIIVTIFITEDWG